MPLYEYRCGSCSRQFEILQALGAAAGEAVCPDCGARESERQLSTFAVSNGGTSSPARAQAFDGGGCSLPQCGGGRCAGGDWN